MKKEFIKNRDGKNISVLIDESENSNNLVFISHGLGSSKEESQLEVIAQAFKDNDFTVVRFDTVNGVGESDGKLDDATATNHCQNLEDVIKWAESQRWYHEPFWLAGHSLGSFSLIMFTLKYPEKVKAIAPISTVVSGKLFIDTEEIKSVLDDWRSKGLREWESSSRPGLIKRLKYGFIEDLLQYDLLNKVSKINCPVLMAIGDNDPTVLPEHQVKLFDLLQTEKEFHIIKGAKHTFRDENHLKELKTMVDNWIKKIKLS